MPATSPGATATRALILAFSLIALVPAFAHGQVPDPLDRGPYTPQTLDPFHAGRFQIQEPNSDGVAPGPDTSSSRSAQPENFQLRGSAYYPSDRSEPSPLIVLVHGNHSSCDVNGAGAPDCDVFKRNDSGYAYLGENLASWGYTVISVDQDQLMSRQDSQKGKGMHQRRLLIAATLDAFKAANNAPQPADPDNNLGSTFTGKLDMTRIGMMGHSRGGDAVTSFLDFNRIRTDGERYPIRGVISLAPVDYERKAPQGTPYMTILPWCDGDVSNLQGARFYERSQYVNPNDPFPRIQSSVLGANHNWFNTVWFADGQDGGGTVDAACGNREPDNVQPNNTRLSGEAVPGAYVIDNSDKLNPEVNTRISGDPDRMGDQEKIGLALMSSFFRRYVGGEGAFDPYMTGELNEDELPQIPESACPTSESGVRMDCAERVSNSYFAAPEERLDVIRPETTNPLELSALGTTLTGTGFSNPYLDSNGVTPATSWDPPPATPDGYDWCNPEPIHFAPDQLGLPAGNSTPPLAAKPCPLPALDALGGQDGLREDAPVNQSYGRQLALAWDGPATLGTTIPAATADVSGFKALAMGADVNFFDNRNPARGGQGEWDPAASTQDFEIVLTDEAGTEGAVEAGHPRYGNALHQTLGTNDSRTHIILDQIRVPLDDFADQGVDLSALESIELRFGGAGYPATGSIQLADVRFQEAAGGTDVLVDSTAPDAGPATGPPSSGPDPADALDEVDPSAGNLELPDVVALGGSSTWTVDDDKTQCPNASFTSVQAAVDHANPWDTIVICAGVYEESSGTYIGAPFPSDDLSSPVESGARNGLTITKPLKIKGAGADEVTIRPAPELGPSLAGASPYLRDGAGNVITVSRQSLGSTDDNENFVDISGVTVESPTIYAEAGIAFHNANGRISESVVGPLKRAANASQLAAMPHGWGVVSTNILVGSGPGTVRRQVTVEDSLITGYQSGGILFDGGRGADGSAENAERFGIIHRGYVEDTVVDGFGASSLIPQTGIQYANGFDGHVTGSRITGNLFPTDKRASVGILLTDAATEDGWSATGNVITDNGYGAFNANAANDAVRDAAPAEATGNYWGTGGPPVEGESLPGLGIEGVSGDDTNGDDSVLFDPVLEGEPDVPSGPPAPPADEPPNGEIVEPGDGDEIAVGESVKPTVLASDDFGVRSVTMTAGGLPLGVATEAPYEFEWSPNAALAGSTVTLTAQITDSSGQVTTSAVDVAITSEPAPPSADDYGESTETGFKLGKLKRNARTGTAKLAVTVTAPGDVALKGKGVRATSKSFDAAGTKKLKIAAKGASKRALKSDGSVKVKAKLTYTPAEGDTVTKTRKVKLVLAR